MEEKHKEDIIRAIGNLEGKVDATNDHLKTLNGQVATHAKEIVDLRIVDTEVLGIVKPIKDFDKRIRYTENKIWYIIGIGVATVTIFLWIGNGWFDDIKETIENNTQTAVEEYINNHNFELVE